MLFAVNFKAKKSGKARIAFIEGAALASDGQGTNILTSMGGAEFTLAPQISPPQSMQEAGQPSGNGSVVADEKLKNTDKKSTEVINNNDLGIISSSHPDQARWYPTNKASFAWKLPVGMKSASYELDDKPATNPAMKPESGAEFAEFQSLEDGIWYFHLRLEGEDGPSAVTHYRIQIDTTPPRVHKIEIREEASGDWPTLFFGAQDKESGVYQYEIIVGSLEERGYILSPEEESLKITNVSPGEHTALIKAVDMAGNASYATVEFEVRPASQPEITSYSKEIRPADEAFFAGTAKAGESVTVYIQDPRGQISSSTVQTDQSGGWHLITASSRALGRYVVWAEARNLFGVPSMKSPSVSYLVSPSAFVQIGSFVINYFAMITSLLFMTSLIILFVVLSVVLVRKRLRKETFEIESVFRDNFQSLTSVIEEELGRPQASGGMDRSENLRMKKRVRDRIALTEKKILKEIRDVEKLLQ